MKSTSYSGNKFKLYGNRIQFCMLLKKQKQNKLNSLLSYRFISSHILSYRRSSHKLFGQTLELVTFKILKT